MWRADGVGASGPAGGRADRAHSRSLPGERDLRPRRGAEAGPGGAELLGPAPRATARVPALGAEGAGRHPAVGACAEREADARADGVARGHLARLAVDAVLSAHRVHSPERRPCVWSGASSEPPAD